MEKKTSPKRGQTPGWKASGNADVKTFAKAAKTFSGTCPVVRYRAVLRSTWIIFGVG
ncbi:hypothetical protein [Bradyrhizobium elkanii]